MTDGSLYQKLCDLRNDYKEQILKNKKATIDFICEIIKNLIQYFEWPKEQLKLFPVNESSKDAPIVDTGRDRSLLANPGPKKLWFTSTQASGSVDTNKGDKQPPVVFEFNALEKFVSFDPNTNFYSIRLGFVFPENDVYTTVFKIKREDKKFIIAREEKNYEIVNNDPEKIRMFYEDINVSLQIYAYEYKIQMKKKG